MRQLLILIVLTFMSVSAIAQKRKLPPKGTHYPISKEVYEFSRQVGKFEVIQNHHAGQTIFRTDSSDLVVDVDGYASFLPGWSGANKSAAIHDRLDSMVALLFFNGLLTADLFISAFNAEAKYIDHKGDTIDVTRHVDTKAVKIRYIRQLQSAKVGRQKGALLFEAAVTFAENLKPYQLPAIHNFVFYLQGSVNPSSSNFTAYVKTVKISYLRYTGTQI